MSGENVEIVRRAFEGFLAGMERGYPGGGIDTGAFAEDFEWAVDPEFVAFEGRRVWRGREEVIEFMSTWTEPFEDWSAGVERMIDAGDDRVVALLRQSATGKESGAPVEFNVGQVYELEDGRIARVTSYASHADALEAAGLSE
jgi:ketosteroid isomerase-like protein